ncbi:hypothetical protein EKD04_004825 [Chloroflexales bacterium ZM16-3]|nr:hypothetical protein [Chloroflexales bacterium ZM16-3]
MSETSFSLGVTYWPRPQRAGAPVLSSWGVCDHGAVRDDLAHVAALGFDAVRLELRWAEAQPGPSRISTAALGGLERGLDAAHAVGLRATVAIMAGALGGAAHLPAWAVGFRDVEEALRARQPDAPPVPAILADGAYRAEPARDLYADPDMRAAARYLLRETVGNFAAHPAAHAWELAAGLGRARRAPSQRAAAAWWEALAELARANGAPALVGVVDGDSLTRSDSLRPAQIVAAGASLAVSAATFSPPRVSRPWETDYAALIHAVAAGLLRAEGRAAPVTVTDLGLPTATEGRAGWVESESYGVASHAFLADEERQGRFVEAALDGLWRAGAGGVMLAGYGDVAPGLWAVPPVDRAWPARSWGLVAADGREKPAAAALSAFAARLRAKDLPTPAGPPAMPIDPERYWRDPQAALAAIAADWRDGVMG